MLTLTDSAAVEIRTLTADPNVPDDAGLRIATSSDGANLLLSIAPEPDVGDSVVEKEGARVFLEPSAAVLLNDQALETAVDDDGRTRFAVNPQQS